MGYHSQNTDALMTELFKKTGAFFAFSNSQFDEAKTEGVEYMSMGAGLICPIPNAKELQEGIETISTGAVAQDMADNTVKEIIHRELANHEAQVTGYIDDTLDALANYPITREDVEGEWNAFMVICDHDYF